MEFPKFKRDERVILLKSLKVGQITADAMVKTDGIYYEVRMLNEPGDPSALYEEGELLAAEDISALMYD